MPTDAPRTPDDSVSGLVDDGMHDAPFPYMRFAKARFRDDDPRSLGRSGLGRPGAGVPAGLLPEEVGTAEPALKAALARRYDVTPEHVHLAQGSSGANFLAYHTFARAGAVVAETPAYQALHALAPAVGATLQTFGRDPDRGWRIDAEALTEVAGDTDLIVATDLHNPSGAALHPDDLDLLVETVERLDALLLVDEVYLDFTPERRSAVHASDRVVVTNSLTKVHGLGSLRAGWLLAHPDRIRALDEADDLVNPARAETSLAAAVRYLPYADACVAETIEAASARREQVDAWVQTTDGASWQAPDGGLTGFLELPGIDGDRLCALLARDHDVLAVPGSFFQRPEGVRISYLLPERVLAEALASMGRVLAELRS